MIAHFSVGSCALCIQTGHYTFKDKNIGFETPLKLSQFELKSD